MKLKTLFKFRVSVKKIDRILEFKQKTFLKPYIERNTDFWKEAKKEDNKIENKILN